jgi:hypothetical protein
MKRPTFLERKETLFSPKTRAEELVQWGDHYLREDRPHDAVAFFRQAGHGDGLRRIREMAVEQGDFFLFRETLDGMETGPAEREVMAKLAARAEMLGRWHDARKAYERLTDQPGLQRVHDALARLMGRAPQDRSPEQGG